MISGERSFPTAYRNWREKQMAFVDQIVFESISGQFCASDTEIRIRCRLHLPYLFRIERTLDACVGGQWRIQGPGEHHFVRCLSYVCEVGLDGGLLGQAGFGFPRLRWPADEREDSPLIRPPVPDEEMVRVSLSVESEVSFGRIEARERCKPAICQILLYISLLYAIIFAY
jgi:hypothetical protein